MTMTTYVEQLKLLVDNYAPFNASEITKLLSQRPVVLVYIDADSYGGNATCFPGVGDPLVIVFDGGRYDKYNRSEDSNPYNDYEDDLKSIEGTEAHETLHDWVSQAGDECGVDGPWSEHE